MNTRGTVDVTQGRIPNGGFRKLGLINWVINKIAARVIQAPRMHLFATLGQHKRLFWAWFYFGAVLLCGQVAQTRHRVGDPAGGASTEL